MITSLVIGLLLTVITLWLTLVTISKGYGYEHTIDSLDEVENEHDYTNHKKIEI